MKITKKDYKFNIVLSHRDLVLIVEALKHFDRDTTDLDNINDRLFDKDEIKSENKVEKIVDKMITKINSVLGKIRVY